VRRVLLVEDNADDAAWTQLLLARSGTTWDCEVKGSVRAGVERLRQGAIDVVLLDLGLPDSLGTSAVQQVVSAAPGVPVIVMTGHVDDVRTQAALEAGARHCVVKGELDAAGLGRLLLEVVQG
jgi:DNA-binding response OmpR family regulator